MSTIKLSRTVLCPIPFRWWQPGKVAPVDCTGFSCTVHNTSLPYTPQISAVDLSTGQFQINAPDASDAEMLVIGRSYVIHILWRDASTTPIGEFRVRLEAV